MATRCKTIEYIFRTDITTRAAAVGVTLGRYDGQPVTINIPETDITFTSVSLELMLSGDNTTAGNLTTPTVGFKLGPYTVLNMLLSNPVANSTEAEAWKMGANFTSTFIQYWTGNTTSMTAQVFFTGGTIATANHSAKLLITYNYNDTAPIQIKTIKIPIESTLTTLTTTVRRINSGTTASPAQGYPNFNSYLPEVGKTIRQEWIELWGNEATASNGDFTVQLRISGSSYVDWWRSESALISARWAYGIVDTSATGRTLTQAVPLECILLTTTSRMSTVGGMACCTYEFDVTGSTTIFNSLLLGGVDTEGFIGGTGFTDRQVWERNIYIEEPDPIVLKDSAVCCFINDNVGFSVIMSVSGNTTGQTEQTYVMTAGSLQCGQYSFVHRIDSYGQNRSAGLIPKRGNNIYKIHFRSNTLLSGWNLSAFLLFNYTSGKHSLGPGVHAHTCYHFILPEQTVQTSGSVLQTTGATNPSLPESFYYLIGAVFYIPYDVLLTTATASGIVLAAEELSDEGSNGWNELYSSIYRTDSENENMTVYSASRTAFKRWPSDMDNLRLDIKQPRNYRFDSASSLSAHLGLYYTYNSISYTISGTCSGYSGDGSGINIHIYRIPPGTTGLTNDELILTTTTVAGGTFSTTWVDNTDTLYAVAREDNTHVGRSGNYQAG